MTTLADLQPHDQFLFACQVVTADSVNGLSLALYGPGRAVAAAATIALDGTMAGQLAAAPDQVPVTVVTGFVPVSVGDVMENQQSGETAVCRWSSIQPDGTVLWASSAAARVVYPASGWTVISKVDL